MIRHGNYCKHKSPEYIQTTVIYNTSIMTNKSNVCVAFVLNSYEFYQTPLKKYIFQFAFQSPANVF